MSFARKEIVFSATDPSLREKCIRISRYQIRQRRKICRNKSPRGQLWRVGATQPVHPASVDRFAAIHQACGSNQRNTECRRALPLSPSFKTYFLYHSIVCLARFFPIVFLTVSPLPRLEFNFLSCCFGPLSLLSFLHRHQRRRQHRHTLHPNTTAKQQEHRWRLNNSNRNTSLSRQLDSAPR